MKNPEIESFIKDVDRIVHDGGTEEVLTGKIAERMRHLLQADNILPSQYRQPNQKYALYPLYIADDESFSIAVAVWDVGQSTPVHDHGTWGVIGVVQGTEHEIQYASPSNKHEELIACNDRYILQGEVVVCCSTDQDLHKVECASNDPCVGIHVYGGNIGKIERHIYDTHTGKKRVAVSHWVPVPASRQ
ncbi:cysteine dioxygenase family protein [Bacillus mojavensis]|uniref:cysteine dioxygenase family protein n=1 Tax=Bacillus mojavensis TaxID=72360 RepID=UPI0022819225|nr:cysteine dioxygenase family protein [Bacillus mojavensis]MCY9093299.1 cysteine dioxygenase family protein [Bacillus mojavensis]MEC1799833.1 cysteine dioxygenase family protein [Bacillus mojavensis]